MNTTAVDLAGKKSIFVHRRDKSFFQDTLDLKVPWQRPFYAAEDLRPGFTLYYFKRVEDSKVPRLRRCHTHPLEESTGEGGFNNPPQTEKRF